MLLKFSTSKENMSHSDVDEWYSHQTDILGSLEQRWFDPNHHYKWVGIQIGEVR
jgi:hypothetical protein